MDRPGDKALGFAALGLSGVAAYGFLAVAGHALGPRDFAPLGALWALVFLATAAVAGPLELAVARSVAASRARQETPRAAARSGFVLAILAGITAAATMLLVGGWLEREVFAGHAGYSASAAAAFGGLMLGAVAKGVCAGSDHLAGWGSYLLADGGTRLALAVVAASAMPTPAAFAAALAIAPWIALLAPAVPLRKFLAAGHPLPERESVVGLARSAAPLIVAAAVAAALTYMGAVMLPFLEPAPSARVGATIGALSLARVPLFVLAPLVAIAVPRIAFAAQTDDMRQAWRAAAILVGTAGVTGFVVLLVAGAGEGPVTWLFGPGFVIPEGSLRAVAIAAAGWLIATAATSVAIGFGQGRLAALAWSAGLAVAVVAALIAGPDAFARTDAAVSLGSIAAALSGVLAAGVVLRSNRLRVEFGMSA